MLSPFVFVEGRGPMRANELIGFMVNNKLSINMYNYSSEVFVMSDGSDVSVSSIEIGTDTVHAVDYPPAEPLTFKYAEHVLLGQVYVEHAHRQFAVVSTTHGMYACRVDHLSPLGITPVHFPEFTVQVQNGDLYSFPSIRCSTGIMGLLHGIRRHTHNNTLTLYCAKSGFNMRYLTPSIVHMHALPVKFGMMPQPDKLEPDAFHPSILDVTSTHGDPRTAASSDAIDWLNKHSMLLPRDKKSLHEHGMPEFEWIAHACYSMDKQNTIRRSVNLMAGCFAASKPHAVVPFKEWISKLYDGLIWPEEAAVYVCPTCHNVPERCSACRPFGGQRYMCHTDDGICFATCDISISHRHLLLYKLGRHVTQSGPTDVVEFIQDTVPKPSVRAMVGMDSSDAIRRAAREFAQDNDVIFDGRFMHPMPTVDRLHDYDMDAVDVDLDAI